MDQISSRDLGHIVYAYGIRNVGNPEIYKAFDQRLEQIIDSGEMMDYQTLFNVIYYMMFKENTNEKIWKGIIESTLY